jgi:outer membrane protein insertion porin family
VRAFATDLQAFYRADGRLDAEVLPPRIDIDLQEGVAHVEIEIHEGHEHAIAATHVPEPVREALGTEIPEAPVGKALSDAEVQQYAFALRATLRKRGHPTPRIDVHVMPSDRGEYLVDLHVEGEAGPRAVVAGVEVGGNERTMSAFIRGKLALEAGDDYDGNAVDEALRKLYGSGLFRTVQIEERPVDGDPGRLLLHTQVEELDSRSLELLAGYGSYERLRGGVRLEERNLFGTGRGIAWDNRLSTKGYGTGVTVSDTDFLSTGSTLSVGGEYFRRETPAFIDGATGGTIALSTPWNSHVTTRFGYTYRDRHGASTTSQGPQDQLVDYIEGRVFAELRIDHRDSLLFPKRGHAEALVLEHVAPELGADVDLTRALVRASGFVTLTSRLVLVLRSEQNVLWPHDGSARVPLQERFFSGGEDSVRSFREQQLGPKDATGLPIGGEFRNLFGGELRWSMIGTLEAATFVDAGNVGSSVNDFGLDDMRYAIGAGLRLLLPIGPIRVDGAWNPDREPGDRGWTVHFSVGYPF